MLVGRSTAHGDHARPVGQRRLVRDLRPGRLGRPRAAAAARRGRHRRRRLSAFVGQWVAHDRRAGVGAWIAGTVFSGVACIFARRQQELLEQLREAQAGLADRAAAEERNRIAHELHDVIGHALTVSLLHITRARLALDEDPAEARRRAGRGRAARPAEPRRGPRRRRADEGPVDRRLRCPGVDQIDELVDVVPPGRLAGRAARSVGDLVRAHRHRGADRLPDPAGGAHQRRPARAGRAGHGAARGRPTGGTTGPGRQRRAHRPGPAPTAPASSGCASAPRRWAAGCSAGPTGNRVARRGGAPGMIEP